MEGGEKGQIEVERGRRRGTANRNNQRKVKGRERKGEQVKAKEKKEGI